MQVGCPIPIKLIGIIQCKDKSEMKRREKELHRQFKEYNTVGEWFRIVTEITAYIDEFAESGEDIMELDCNSYREKMRQRNANREKPQYKYDSEYRREYRREYRQRPEVKERRRKEHREYQQKPEVKERERQRKQTAEYKEQQRQYRQRPEVKGRNREYQREYKRNRKKRTVS